MTSIYTIFTFGFFTRSIYDVVGSVNGTIIDIWLGDAFPLLWDWLPIFMVCLFHLKEVRSGRRDYGEVPSFEPSAHLSAPVIDNTADLITHDITVPQSRSD